MPVRLHTVAETPQYLRDADRVGLSDEARQEIVDSVAANPLQGNEVVGSGGVRKVRLKGRGKGKSGGFRVMVAYVGESAPTYLLAILSKGDKGSFTAAQVAAMKAVITHIKRHWKARK